MRERECERELIRNGKEEEGEFNILVYMNFVFIYIMIVFVWNGNKFICVFLIF